MTLCALLEVADKQPTTLHPVLREYENLLEAKRTGRWLNVGSREFRDAAIEDLLGIKDKSYRWAQKWLTEFRNNPDDNFHGRFVRESGNTRPLGTLSIQSNENDADHSRIVG